MLDFAEVSGWWVILFFIYLLTLVLFYEKPKVVTHKRYLSLSFQSKLKALWKISILNVTIHNYRPEAVKTVVLASKLIILRHFTFKSCMLCWGLNNVNLTWLQSSSHSSPANQVFNNPIFLLSPPRSQVLSVLPNSTFHWWRDKAALFPATASLSLCLSLDLPTGKNRNAAPSFPSEPVGLRLLWAQS